MNNFVSKLICLSFVLFISLSTKLYSQQTTISGNITDGNEALIGVNILVKGKVIGTISNKDGNFSLNVNSAPPLTLVFSIVGYESQELEFNGSESDVSVTMLESAMLGKEIVVSASRVAQNILEAPVTIEKMDLLAIQNASTADFMDQLEHIKGVKVSRGSMNFPAVNTRGFATDANTRFVQLVDGMDTSAPLLNFPTGNLVGINPLDLESIELIPGSSSALYGPNAYNGTMLMSSKSPFDYQGLSVQVTQGLTSSQATGDNNYHYSKYNIRYAKAFNDKIAIKVNFSYDEAQDWTANDYNTHKLYPDSSINLTGLPNFDGLNVYGDEVQVAFPAALGGAQYASFGLLDLRRTGFPEEFLVDNDASNMKYDASIHYRINDNTEASFLFRKGGGSSIYVGTEKYALRDFGQQFMKLAIKGDKLNMNVYQSTTDAGDSYNLTALGIFMNERFKPTLASWVPTYLQTYITAMQGYVPGVPAGNSAAAHQASRAQANSGIPANGSTEFNTVRDQVIKDRFQSAAGGAGFFDNSKLTHFDLNFDATNWLLLGINYRNYSIFTEGTIFNEDPDGTGTNSRININEYGAFAQIRKELMEDIMFTGSVRWDKNENFKGRVTPRLALVYSFAENSHLRISYQTGFRNPDSQAQYIYFPSSTGTILGSARNNAERYGIMEGGAYSVESYDAFIASGGVLDSISGNPIGGTPAVLQTTNVSYVKPERLSAYEIGYKGLIADNFLADINYYSTNYRDFLSGVRVVSKNATTHKGAALPPGSRWSVHSNAKDIVKSWGIGVGFTWNLPENFVLQGNYNYQDYKVDYASEASNFLAYFNTPKNMYGFTFSNRQLVKNLGFSASFRTSDSFLYESTFAEAWEVPQYSVLDAQVNYKIESLKTIVKVGGNNIGIGSGDYRTRPGGPFVGKLWYMTLTFDEFLN